MLPEFAQTLLSNPTVAVAFGTTGPDLQSCVGRAIAVGYIDGDDVFFIVPTRMFDTHKLNLESNKWISLNVVVPGKHQSIQFKGKCLNYGKVSDADYAVAVNSVDKFGEVLRMGYGESTAEGLKTYLVRDLTRINFHVSEIYNGTPGPEAGKKIELTQTV